eukprot:XP_014054260.1 PREDICTED: uncharacterized protein LOC106604291 [Salmo salar]
MYRRVLGLSPSNVDACVKATCVLHNYLRRSFQEPLRMEMGTPNCHLPDVTRAGAINAPRQALQVREKLTTYFSSPADLFCQTAVLLYKIIRGEYSPVPQTYSDSITSLVPLWTSCHPGPLYQHRPQFHCFHEGTNQNPFRFLLTSLQDLFCQTAVLLYKIIRGEYSPVPQTYSDSITSLVPLWTSCHPGPLYQHRPQFHCFHEGTNQNPFRFLLTSLQAVVVIVFLNMLHRCLSNNLRTEILKDLSNLTPENFTYPKRYRVPTLKMQEKACECQGMFATELKHVVNKVKARTEEHKPLLNRLQKNIQALPQISTPEEASICPMKDKLLLTRPPKTIVLIAYRHFLQNLNEKECK